MRVSQQQQACAGYQGKASRDARKLASSAYYQYKSRSDLSNSFFDSRSTYNMLWCPVFKAASTNWMTNIITMAGLSQQQKIKLEKKYKK